MRRGMIAPKPRMRYTSLDAFVDALAACTTEEQINQIANALDAPGSFRWQECIGSVGTAIEEARRRVREAAAA
jgi:hypothetical protein